MTNMQKQVTKEMSLGSAGEVLKGLHSFYLENAYSAKDFSVKAGCFVQLDGNFIKGASGNAITGNIIGVAIKNKYISSIDNTDVFPKDDNVSVLQKGVILIINTATAACTEGQYVFLKTADGTLGFASNPTTAGYTYTGFKVYKGGGVNEVIAIVSE